MWMMMMVIICVCDPDVNVLNDNDYGDIYADCVFDDDYDGLDIIYRKKKSNLTLSMIMRNYDRSLLSVLLDHHAFVNIEPIE